MSDGAKAWIQQVMDKLRSKEEEIYSAIGANDPEAVAAYYKFEEERITAIAEDFDARGYNWEYPGLGFAR